MRLLNEREISALKARGCTAQDWTDVSVSEEFAPDHISNTAFYGEVQLGVFEKSVETGSGFTKHSGISGATLRNVSVGDNCLIENIGGYINNCVIGDDCLISNVAVIETAEGATFGQGTVISVLDEAGRGNVLLCSGLTAQVAALMVRYGDDAEFSKKLWELMYDGGDRSKECGIIGNRCRISNTGKIINSVIGDDAEIDGACRLSDCTILGTPSAPVYIGSGVICENSIICDGTSILNSSKLENCFVGEACQIKNSFTAENSVFFANCFMANGEASAAFCGPFSSSHHKSSLLIGTALSFYNAGSGTNFSNHAYKLGPVHYGILERGVKTASGAHVLLPARIGQFSVCIGKIACHPDTRELPFSYLISDGKENLLVPGRNLVTVGLWRDIHKWKKRDRRVGAGTRSIVNFDWLSPFAAVRIAAGKKILEDLRRVAGESGGTYKYRDYLIKASSLDKGVRYYDIALRLFMGGTICGRFGDFSPERVEGGEWSDLAGMLLPRAEEERVVSEVRNGGITSAGDLLDALRAAHGRYGGYRLYEAVKLALSYYSADSVTDDLKERIAEDFETALREWKDFIRQDAYREYELGDVRREVLDDFLRDIDAGDGDWK